MEYGTKLAISVCGLVGSLFFFDYIAVPRTLARGKADIPGYQVQARVLYKPLLGPHKFVDITPKDRDETPGLICALYKNPDSTELDDFWAYRGREHREELCSSQSQGSCGDLQKIKQLIDEANKSTLDKLLAVQ